ncbi:MAG: S41 family peptidase [Bacteroidia bacterium]
MNKLVLISVFLIQNCIGLLSQNKSFHSKELTKHELSNIAAFAKLYGYVRHFYPSTEVEEMRNWEQLIAVNLPYIEQSQDVLDLKRNFIQIFSPYAPLLRINDTIDSVYKFPQKQYIVYRKNKGWGNRGENATRVNFIYTSELIWVPIDSVLPDGILSPNQRLNKKVNNDISISWPMSVYADDSFTLPHNSAFKLDTSKYNFTVENRFVRMGCIIELWNVMQHFYPYMDVMKIQNDSLLEKYLQLASEAQNENDFFHILELFGAEYKDGHAAFMPYPYSSWEDYVPPIRLDWIENKLIVTYSEYSDSSNLKVGDEVIYIDYISSEEYFKNKSARVSSATATWNSYYSCKEILCGKLNSTISLQIKTENGKIRTRTFKRTLKVDGLEKKANTRTLINEYSPAYYYIDLCNLTDSILQELEQSILPLAKGIVFDMRGYPRIHVEKLFRHLYQDTMYSAIWQIPISYFPDQDKRNVQMDTSGRWIIAPSLPRFTNNVVFIIDGRVISAAETEMGIVENYKLGKIIGEQSAGTNGNVNSFKIYGLYMFWFTGMKVIKHDGSRHHGVGILPNVIVKKTIQDVREGRDPFIETAKRQLH